MTESQWWITLDEADPEAKVEKSIISAFRGSFSFRERTKFQQMSLIPVNFVPRTKSYRKKFLNYSAGNKKINSRTGNFFRPGHENPASLKSWRRSLIIFRSDASNFLIIFKNWHQRHFVSIFRDFLSAPLLLSDITHFVDLYSTEVYKKLSMQTLGVQCVTCYLFK